MNTALVVATSRAAVPVRVVLEPEIVAPCLVTMPLEQLRREARHSTIRVVWLDDSCVIDVESYDVVKPEPEDAEIVEVEVVCLE